MLRISFSIFLLSYFICNNVFAQNNSSDGTFNITNHTLGISFRGDTARQIYSSIKQIPKVPFNSWPGFQSEKTLFPDDLEKQLGNLNCIKYGETQQFECGVGIDLKTGKTESSAFSRTKHSGEYIFANGTEGEDDDVPILSVFFTGKPAEKTYKAIPSKSIENPCMGGFTKFAKEMQCNRDTDNSYECSVGISLRTGKLVSITC
jgi:hypothetical protein